MKIILLLLEVQSPAVPLLFFLVLVPLAILILSLSTMKRRRERLEADMIPVFALSTDDELILEKYTVFFAKMNLQTRMIFMGRLKNFINDHEFEGRDGLEVTREMKVLVAAAAIHLSLGLDDYSFMHFDRIFIYPHVYYSGLSRSDNRGETNPHGIIVFTWPFIEEGFANCTDAINLGYHEFAHALVLQNSMQVLQDTVFWDNFMIFENKMREEGLARKVYDADFLRDYAFTNKMEFFAASAECFIETPEIMKEKCAEWYYLLMTILRHDPINFRYGFFEDYVEELMCKFD